MFSEVQATLVVDLHQISVDVLNWFIPFQVEFKECKLRGHLDCETWKPASHLYLLQLIECERERFRGVF